MRRFQPLGALLLIPALALFAAAPGCGKKDEPAPKKKDDKSSGGKVEPSGARTELASTGWGTLTGTVTYDGDPPIVKMDFSGKTDAQGCMQGKGVELLEQTWIVDPDTKGVANVVVFLKPPEGKYFKLKDEDKDRKDVVELRQPHCAFLPHVSVLYPAYWDGKAHKTSGQKFKVFNDAAFVHNTNYVGEDTKGGFTLKPGDNREINLEPGENPTTVSFSCDIHKWMNAKTWVFDHPYAARTDEKGKFELKNVPTGAEVQLVVWHEDVGYHPGYGGKDGKKVTLNEKNVEDIKIKKGK